MSHNENEAEAMKGSCEEMHDLLAAYVDGELPEDLHEQVKKHLEACSFCREESKGFAEIRQQLRALRVHQRYIEPAPHVWREAQRVWRRRERLERARFAWRPALAFSMLLLAIFSFVWARLNSPDIFPVRAALQDFEQVEHQVVQPAFAQSNPDRAAVWLRDRLHANIPPINLSLSRGGLLGADVVSLDGVAAARLLYRTPHGLVGIYIVPRHGRFGSSLSPLALGRKRFYTLMPSKGPVLYAWSREGTGYALLVDGHSVPRDTLLDAAQATDPPGSAP